MIHEALVALRPGARFDLNGDTVAGIVWKDQQQTRPTDAEITAKAAEIALPLLKQHLKAQVAADAEACRLKFVTPGSGKAMTYLEKHNQASAVLELGEAAANALTTEQCQQQFPTLAASVGVEAPALWSCAQIIIARYEAWATVSYAIERAELAGKKAISDASDAAAARAAYEAITWPSP